jgi:hypothetical protein
LIVIQIEVVVFLMLSMLFNKDGFDILNEFNFTYATCDFCPGEYWTDNKSGEHTLFIYSTQQPLSNAIVKLGKLVKDNVHV